MRERHGDLKLCLLRHGGSLDVGCRHEQDASFLPVRKNPVVLVIVLVALLEEQMPEELPEVIVIGPMVEVQRPAVVQKGNAFLGLIFTDLLRCHLHLHLGDAFELRFLRRGLQALPGQCAENEVHEHVADRFEIVTARLFAAFVSIDRGVPRRARQTLVALPRNVHQRVGISVPFRQAEVDDVHDIARGLHAHQEII